MIDSKVKQKKKLNTIQIDKLLRCLPYHQEMLANTVKRFEFSPLGTELKKKTDIAKRQNQGLDNPFKFYKKQVIKQQIKIMKNQNLKSIINQS